MSEDRTSSGSSRWRIHIFNGKLIQIILVVYLQREIPLKIYNLLAHVPYLRLTIRMYDFWNSSRNNLFSIESFFLLLEGQIKRSQPGNRFADLLL